MPVLIKMEMPKGCCSLKSQPDRVIKIKPVRGCKLASLKRATGWVFGCNAPNGPSDDVSKFTTTRHPDCPLVEVKDSGHRTGKNDILYVEVKK